MNAKKDSVADVKKNDEKESDSEESNGGINTTPTKINYNFQGSNGLKNCSNLQEVGLQCTCH